MGFGQYSTQGVARKSKREMLAAVAEIADRRVSAEIPGASAVVSSRMIARNTMEYTLANGTRRVRLHSTDIFEHRRDGTIKLDTGGWNTKTTRDRFDIALKGTGLRCYTSRAVLYIMQAKDGSYWSGPADGTKPCAFNSTVTARKRKGVYRFASDIAAKHADPSYDALRKHVNRYIKALRDGGIPEDASGDPWVLTGKSSGKHSLSDPQDNGLYPADLVRTWIGATAESEGEPYVFLTFIVAAMKFAGMTDLGIGMHFRDFNREGATGYQRALVCRRVRRYIRACLGFGIS